MTNELRGRIAVKAGSKEYTFHFGFEAVRQLEKLFEVKGWTALSEKLDNFGEWSVETQLQVVRIGLQRFHGQDELTDEKLEEIAFEAGGLVKPAIDAVLAGGKQILGEFERERQAREREAKGDKDAPSPDPQRKARTGKGS